MKLFDAVFHMCQNWVSGMVRGGPTDGWRVSAAIPRRGRGCQGPSFIHPSQTAPVGILVTRVDSEGIVKEPFGGLDGRALCRRRTGWCQ
jgi:hypothetical protein